VYISAVLIILARSWELADGSYSVGRGGRGGGRKSASDDQL